MDININITDKRALAEGTPVIICGNSDYVVNFTFDDEWAAYTAKTARFVWCRDAVTEYADVDFSGASVNAPMLIDVAEVYIGVFAGDLITSTPVRVACERSIKCKAGTPRVSEVG